MIHDVERVAQIWQEYVADRENKELKDTLIMQYAPLVKYLAGRLSVHIGHRVEFDDLISYGIFGLIDAIDKFSLEKGVKFETYASLRIRGAIIDSIRKLDWVPRDLRQKSKLVEQAYADLEIDLGREPSDEEIAQKLGLTIEETLELMKKASIASLVSLDDYLEQNHEENFSVRDGGETPEEEYDRKEVTDILVEAIDKLTDKEKNVVTLYYFEDMTLKEISKTMGVSESRVSQIHSKAVVKLRAKLGKYKGMLNL